MAARCGGSWQRLPYGAFHTIFMARPPTADGTARRVSAAGWGRSLQFLEMGGALTGPPGG
jgi:hypothetical protein